MRNPSRKFRNPNSNIRQSKSTFAGFGRKLTVKTLIGTVLLLAVVFSFACNKEPENKSPLAPSAGKEKLHLDELQKRIPEHPALAISSVQVQNLIQHWAEEELVYQLAISQDFDKKPEIQKKIEELKKNYIVAAYLQEKVDKHIVVSDDEIKSYYDRNSSEFIRPNDYYNIMVLVVDSYAKANELRRQILNGESFEDIARNNSLDASKDDGGALGWVTLDHLPNEIGRRVKSMSPNTISRPIKTVVGYYVVRLVGVRKKGDIQTLEEVHDLIKYRINARKREEGYRQLINQLKENTGMTINWSFIDSLNVIK